MSGFRLLGFAGALVLAALVGGTIMSAVAAAPTPSGGPAIGAPVAAPTAAAAGEYCAAFRAAFAANLGVSEADVTAAAQKAAASTIDKAVTDGALGAAAADRLKARLEGAAGGACGVLDRRIGKAALKLGHDAMTAAAEALGLTRAELRAQLREADGSLQAVATAKGVDYATVSAAVLTAVKADLDAAVKAGTLAQARADRVLKRLTANLAEGRLRRAK